MQHHIILLLRLFEEYDETIANAVKEMTSFHKLTYKFEESDTTIKKYILSGLIWRAGVRVAVLMSTYNGENYMKEQIESILNQRGNFELDLWVRDDGSTDATKKILMQYEIEKKASLV